MVTTGRPDAAGARAFGLLLVPRSLRRRCAPIGRQQNGAGKQPTIAVPGSGPLPFLREGSIYPPTEQKQEVERSVECLQKNIAIVTAPNLYATDIANPLEGLQDAKFFNEVRTNFPCASFLSHPSQSTTDS